jgi:hypothetical protein
VVVGVAAVDVVTVVDVEVVPLVVVVVGGEGVHGENSEVLPFGDGGRRRDLPVATHLRERDGEVDVALRIGRHARS